MKKLTLHISAFVLVFCAALVHAQNNTQHIAKQKNISMGTLQKMRVAATKPKVKSATAVGLSDNTLEIELFNNERVTLVEHRIEVRAANDFSWIGSVEGYEGSIAILVVKNGNITGQLNFAGKQYDINPSKGNLHKLSKIDLDALPSLEGDVHDEEHPIEALESGLETSSTEPTASAAAYAGNAETIDVLAVYSKEAAFYYSDVEERIQLAIDYTNTAYELSGIPHRVNLAAAVALDHNESGTNHEITWMGNLFDGKMDEVHALREQYNADVISFWASHIDNLCGQANAILSGSVSPTHILRVSCGNRTFAHELGHNQGARHNMEQDGTLSPFRYGHGTGAANGSWRTIMSYSNACPSGGICERVSYFSTPNVSLNGEPMGDSEYRDNARVITETGADLAAFSEAINTNSVSSVEAFTTDGTQQVVLEEVMPGIWVGYGELEAYQVSSWQMRIDGVIYGPEKTSGTLGGNFAGRMVPNTDADADIRPYSSRPGVFLYDERYHYVSLGSDYSQYDSMYLRGTMNNWADDNEMTYIGRSLWTTTATFSGEQSRFKFDVHGDWTVNYGLSGNTSGGFEGVATGGDDIIVNVSGTYRVYLDLSSSTYWLVKVDAPQTQNQAPIADAGADITVQVNEAFSLDASASFDSDGSIVNYEWSVINMTGETVEASFSSAGTYVITLTVTDNQGASSTDEIVVLVEEADNATWQRTIVFMYGETQPGQDMFIRGGIDHAYAAAELGRDCTATNFECAVPIRHLNLRNDTTTPWKEGDNYLDWYGLEASQSSGEGSALDWTTNAWDASWGEPNYYEVNGSGETPLNTYGMHYWIFEVEMDCSATANGWFELKSYISNGPAWESDVQQPGAPWVSGNHFAECGKLNVFARGQSNPIEISPL